MKYNDFKLGNIVSLKFSKKFKKIKVGIITALKKDHFIVKWIWYDKVFFLEEDISFKSVLAWCAMQLHKESLRYGRNTHTDFC